MDTDKKSYKESLNLPQTSFAMEAKLVTTEPQRLQRWREAGLYRQILDARAGGESWILHDGPPFANGDIHIGHLINKTLKDVLLRYHAMKGQRTPYVPGWDCHGLPIEHKIQQELGPKLREMSVVEVRQRCQAYAAKFAGQQSEQFQRLGILGDWAHPYLTMDPGYEAKVLEVFAGFVEAGLVYRRLKPVHWSISNQTALADAELEYQDITGPSIFVEFALVADGPLAGKFAEPLHLLVWTTTPWTLPANLAVAVHPRTRYAVVRYRRAGAEGARTGIIAHDLVERVFKDRAGVESFEIVGRYEGSELAGLQYTHPFIERRSGVVAAEYVTTTDGTGLVHIAPGHGEEDYLVGQANHLDVYCPVLPNGRFDDSAPEWLRGMKVWDADPAVIAHLRERKLLLDEGKITHSYPHDWRSKTPTIFRATEQWFIALDKPFVPGGRGGGAQSLRQRALASAQKTQFVPGWGRTRMAGMLEARPDWCISRQRAWGLPIPVFYNDKGEALLTPASVRAVAATLGAQGSDAWFTQTPAELLGKDFVYPAGFVGGTLRKEKDIFDVWFESGSSWHAVLQARKELRFPADLYLEGSDQHRGWFQLSLLPSLGVNGEAPYKSVLTHGFVVKPDGTKVSKSDKEYVTATQEIQRHGADVLRLWCCSVDYQNDIPASPKALADFADKYRKLRNTLRYLLSNLYDFDPAKDGVEITAASLDGWINGQLDALIVSVREAYDRYELHRVFRLLHDFCAVQISAVYANAMKDRLYCEARNSPVRRRAQSVMHRIVDALTRLLGPILVFTADEAWEHIPRAAGAARLSSVHLALLPEPAGVQGCPEWDILMRLRDEALLQLDALKKQSGLNKASDAEVIYQVDDAGLRAQLEAYGADLEDLVGAGFHTFAAKEPGAEGAVSVKVVDRREKYAACARCWKRRPDVGGDAAFPELSLRDAGVMKNL